MNRADVIKKLKQKGTQGVTFDDFPRGFAIRSRMSEIRLNHEIRTIMEDVGNGVKRARYFYIKKTKQTA